MHTNISIVNSDKKHTSKKIKKVKSFSNKYVEHVFITVDIKGVCYVCSPCKYVLLTGAKNVNV